MMRVFCFVPILAVVLSGCAALSLSGPKFYAMAQPAVSATKALVYVYRVSDGRWVGRVDVSVDGREIAAIGDWEFSWCELTPGAHTLRAEWGVMDKPMFEGGHFDAKSLGLSVEAGQIYYVCYAIREDDRPPTVVEGSGLLGKALSKSHVTSVTFLSQDDVSALSKIKGCSLRKSGLVQ